MDVPEAWPLVTGALAGALALVWSRLFRVAPTRAQLPVRIQEGYRGSRATSID